METLTCSATWQALQGHHAELAKIPLMQFTTGQQFQQFSFNTAGLFVDLSKNYLNQETLSLLTQLANERQLPARIEALFAGNKVNVTENRAAQHSALRQPKANTHFIDGHNIISDIHDELLKMQALAEMIQQGQWRGFSGKPITDIVHIGVGGS